MAKDSDTTPLRVDAPFAKGYQAAPLIEPMDDFQEPSYQRQQHQHQHQQHQTHKGISSDAPPAVITWDRISYEVIVKTGKPFKKVAEKKVLLNNVSGFAKPGELLAIMGATGAGKSTLLDVLAQRKNAGSLSGRLLVNGAVPDKFYKRLSAYVTQDDCLMGFQTVRETLKFYADLKLPSVLSQEARNRKVDEIIAELSLEKVRDSRVGTQFIRGISGGEKKRLSIGCQMITDPSLLFLDEPTTGLDAYNSLSVLESLKSLARSGKTVVCTIHQPRSTIFSLFDQMMVLSQARVAYFGQASEAVNYFSSLGFHCGQFINPADFFIDITIENERTYNHKPLLVGSSSSSSSSSSSHDPEAQRDGRLDSLLGPQPHSSVNIVEAYEASEVHQRVRKEVQEINAEYSRNRGKQQDSRMMFTSEYASNFFKQFFFLSSRMLRNLFRNPMVTYAQLFQTIFMALLVGSLYFDLGLSQSSIQNRVGCLFFMTTNQAFSTFASLNLFLEERDLFNRERAGGTYSTSAYFIAKSVVEAPLFLLFPIIFTLIAYFMVGFQQSWEAFGIFVAAIVTFAATASSLFLFIGSISPNQVIATILCPLVTVLLMLFGGFYVNTNTIPVYYVWIKYISFFNYGFAIVTYNEFNGLEFVCTPGVTNCVQTGVEELTILGLEDTNLGYMFGALVIMIVVYRLMAYTALRFLYKEKR